jgi:D-beta-D-heptose 7-phosphate kinase/D-beta-D-heptose 1-phosphate adenosyltransferase
MGVILRVLVAEVVGVKNGRYNYPSLVWMNPLKLFGTPTELLPYLKECRSLGKRIVFTNGVFDLLHYGHVTYLKDARARGDCLVVALNSDASVRRYKGPLKPLVPLAERAEMLLALDCVDFATFFDEDTPYEAVKTIHPDILVKGGDWPVDKIVGADLVLSWGGKVESIPYVEGRSTTNLVESVRERYA